MAADILNLTGGEIGGAVSSNYPGLVLYIIFLYLAAFVFVWITGYLLQHISELFSKDRSTIKMLIPLVKIFFYAVATWFVFIEVIKPNYAETIAFFGLFGAGIGFGLKDLLANIIGGIIIIIEKPYQVGDKISFGSHYGEVTDIGLRTTQMITPDDNVVTIPNFQIFSDPVASGNYGSTAMMVTTDLFIDNTSNYNRAQILVRETIASSPYVIISDEYPYTVLVQSFPFYRRIRARAYVTDHRFEFEFQSDLNRRAWDAMNGEEIKAPLYPALLQEE